MQDNFTVYILNSTHWDREWYQNFQGFRYRLVEMGDELIDKLEQTPDFTQFVFDGQTIVLEDYLEIAPENKERMAKLIKNGRIAIGPWYVMPDEYIVSGESLIKNLQIGHKICRDYGVKPMKYGYICDIFGHTAQMPQIFAGFGIKGALLGRGTNEEDFPAHFLWESPDGTKAVTFKLRDKFGYGDICIRVIRNGGTTEAELKASLKQVIEDEKKRSEVPVLLLMDGQDHQPIHTQLLDYKRYIEEMYPNATVKFAGLEDMLSNLEQYTDLMPTHKGEINDTARNLNTFVHLITNTLSGRVDLKLANDKAQTEMEKWAGPLTALTSLFGSKALRKSYYDTAYKYLIQNHPHDSICGCSIDETHRDMKYRYDQTMKIGHELREYSMNYLTSGKDGKDMLLSVINPLPFARKETVRVDLWFDVNYTDRYYEPFRYEQKNSFYIVDASGNQVPYKIVNINRGKKRVYAGKIEQADRHTVVFEADMPAGGIAQYRIVPAGDGKAVRYMTTLLTGRASAENEFIAVNITENGTLTVTDKTTGQLYENQLTFVSDGEIGDGWFHCAPSNDKSFLSLGAPANVSIKEDTPARAILTLEKTMLVPKGIERNNELNPDIRRSEELLPLKLTADIILDKSANYVKVELKVDNKSKNHRLRLMLPTGITADKYFASEAFCTVERKVSLDLSRQMWREAPQHEKAMTSFAYKREGSRGLAFVSGGGLHEIGAFDDSEGNLAITLMRCTGQAEPMQVAVDAQNLGVTEYSFALMPMNKKTTDADLQRVSDIIAAGVQYGQRLFDNPTAVNTELFSISSKNNSVCYSTLKVAEDGNGVILRVYNMSAKADTAAVRFNKPIKNAYLTDMEEAASTAITPENGAVTLKIAPWRIETLRLEF